TGRTSRKITNYMFKEFGDVVSLPYDYSLFVDYSGSMAGVIDSLEKSVHTFISYKDKTDRISIARFDHSLAKVCDLEAKKDSLLKFFTMKGLDTLGGSTALYAGGDYAMNMISGTNNNKILILFTDGMENSSLSYFGQYAYTATQLAKKAKQLGVTIHVIAYGDGVNNPVLQKLAYTTGGNFYKLKNYDDVNRVFMELPIILKNYYVISYKPPAKKGKHSVRILYNNNQGKNYSTVANYMVGDKFTIDEYDKTYAKNYWQKAADSLHKIPVSVPQAVAYFDFDKTKLLDKYKEAIDGYIDYLEKQENTTIMIFGHTDSKGSDKYCYDLSLRRAQKVKDYMVKNGIDENRIFIKGCGKDEMIWKPEDKEWKAHENRRTEILLLN
ncbi:MAG: OmpA family protein, partial [Bacteroidales bacterium]|nr:OmpA family protein [Bacteroidales bacterium]